MFSYAVSGSKFRTQVT